MTIESELSGLNRELSIFPERAFDFKNAGAVIIEQDVADVGSVVWDAEVLLAHYLDRTYGFRLCGRRVLELGAGTGLAGIVAARLGAHVVLTDQSKLLPTLRANARGNAPGLERRPPPLHGSSDNSPLPPAGGETGTASADPPPAPPEKGEEERNTGISGNGSGNGSGSGSGGGSGSGSGSFGSGSGSFGSGGRAGSLEGVDTGSLSGSSIGNGGSGGGASGLRGSWRAEELLFFSGEEDVVRWRRQAQRGEGGGRAIAGRVAGGHTGGSGTGGMAGGNFCGGVGGIVGGVAGVGGGAQAFRRDEDGDDDDDDDGLFDLVVAADVVYLRDLWDAMAFTIKALLKPDGEALMAFEQRRSNVDGFFGAPRFGVGGDCWEGGEELDLKKIDLAENGSGEQEGEEFDLQRGVEGGRELAAAAEAARVRVFRMRRRRGSTVSHG